MSSEEDDDYDPVPKTFGIPAYARFDATTGDEYRKCCPIIKDTGTVIVTPDIGKKHVEEACSALRELGYAIDWYAVKNSVCVKTTEVGDRLVELKKLWRERVRGLKSL